MTPCLECRRHNHSQCERGMVHGTTFCMCGCEVVFAVLEPVSMRPEAERSVQKSDVSKRF